MYYSVEETINEMRALIKEAEEIKVLVENLNRKINTLQQTTFIGEVVKFNGVRQDKDVLEYSLIELDSIIKTQAQLDKLDILYEKENEHWMDLLLRPLPPGATRGLQGGRPETETRSGSQNHPEGERVHLRRPAE